MQVLLWEEAEEQRANNTRGVAGFDVIRIVALSLRWLDGYVGLHRCGVTD